MVAASAGRSVRTERVHLFACKPRISRSVGTSRHRLSSVTHSNPDLLQWKDSILKKYYREETLQSDLAKRIFLFPDKANSISG